ncbi:MAG: tRNA lysidine(34) synthetase TilS [Desulfovibrio sp.]|nr:tRNA lysidine(34) synthetase TilS [Desulfovibrio sp.]
MPVPAGLQDLSPWGAHLCLRVEAFLKELIPDGLEGRSFVLALSGGLDSTALALIMRLLTPRLGADFTAAHLDHGLRPESGKDATACAAFCERINLSCQCGFQNVRALANDWKTGIEDAGRRARYAWLEEIRERSGAFAVLCAHHLNDLAEDQLMRLTRGGGWPALGGMPAWDPGRRILRPLLMTPKADLQRLLEETGTAWREDESNTDQAFMRNRVRSDILPLFIRENLDYLGAAAELWKQARIDEIHWNNEVLAHDPAAGSPQETHVLSNNTLKGCSQALRLRMYKRCVEAIGPGQPLAPTLHGLDEAWSKRSIGKTFQFPGNKVARIEREGIVFLPAASPTGVDT